MEFLKCRIDTQRVHKSDKHIKAIKNASKPPEELQLFLGKATYYEPFIPDLATRSRSLRDILQTSTMDNSYRRSYEYPKHVNITPGVNARNYL